MEDIIMNVAEYIRPELLILIVVLIVIGFFLKKAPALPDWSIPFVLLALGIIFSILYVGSVLGEGYSVASVVTSLIQGILIAGAAVFGNQLYKQIMNAKQNE